jgi:opacity protein-like surface antigen
MKTYLTGALLLVAAPAAAQEAWEFAITPYAYLPGVTAKLNTEFGTVESDTSESDALTNLDFAFMAAFEARRGRLSLIGDLLYANLSSEKDTPLGRLFDSVETDTKVGAFSGYALYRAVETPQFAIDLGGGFRAYSVKYDTTLEPALLDQVSFDLSEEWVDPILAARAIVTFNERWSANAVLDYGGFDGENDSTRQAIASVNYAFNDRWSLRGGWRYLDIQKEIGGLRTETELNGPIIGVGFHF